MLKSAIQIKIYQNFTQMNRLKEQLNKQNNRLQCIELQKAGKEVLPYNLYHNSRPDLVILILHRRAYLCRISVIIIFTSKVNTSILLNSDSIMVSIH